MALPIGLPPKVTQGVYWDGHERKDVKAWRTEYLAEMAQLEK